MAILGGKGAKFPVRIPKKEQNRTAWSSPGFPSNPGPEPSALLCVTHGTDVWSCCASLVLQASYQRPAATQQLRPAPAVASCAQRPRWSFSAEALSFCSSGTFPSMCSRRRGLCTTVSDPSPTTSAKLGWGVFGAFRSIFHGDQPDNE